MRKIFPLFLLLLLLGMGQVFAQNSGTFQSGGGEMGWPRTDEEETGVLIPNAFTPNGDGVNDVFYIPDAALTNFDFQVADRWGNQVFSTKNPSFRWTGDSNGRPLPSGVYVYVMVASSPRKANIKQSGTITIVR